MEGRSNNFEAGEKVIYPQFGMGTIAEIIQKKVDGDCHSFYRLEFPVKQMDVLIPVIRAQQSGMRKVMTANEVDDLVECIASSPQVPKPQQWHRWRKRTQEQLKSGDPKEVAKIYCYLRALDSEKGLSFTERKILIQVEQMLVAEISVAKSVSEDQALELLQVPKGNASYHAPQLALA